MTFDDFVKKGQVRRASEDRNLIKSLINKANEDIEFFNSLKIESKSARKLLSNYYDILRSVLEAIASATGYKIYSHEAFTYFLKEIKNENVISVKFDRFRKIRNSINYYGDDVSVDEAKKIIDEIKRMINLLIKKYLKDYDV